MKYEDQGLIKTSDDDPENKAVNAVKATTDVDDEDVIDTLLDSDDVTPGPSTRTVFGLNKKVWRAKVNLDITTRAQTFRGMARTKKAKGTEKEVNST